MLRLLSTYLNHLAKFYLEHGSGNMTVIAVVGSVGKTSTKIAIGEMFETAGRRVRYSKDSYNSSVGLPLSIFGFKTPEVLKNPFAWIVLLVRCELKLIWRRPEFLVLEMGIDGQGDMAKLTEIVKADYIVLTATTAEHLDGMGDQEAIVAEETSALKTAKLGTIIGIDDVDLKDLPDNSQTFGTIAKAGWRIAKPKSTDSGLRLKLSGPGAEIAADTNMLSLAGLKAIAAAVAVGHTLGIEQSDLQRFAADLRPHSGRMRLFDGTGGSKIIDDSYNSSPAAIVNALDAVADRPETRKIMIMGMVNEMGDHLPKLMTDITDSFNAVDEVILVGAEIASIVQPLLKKNKIKSRTTTNALTAAELVQSNLDQDTLVLVKGSQGGVYLEEAVKRLLANPKDAKQLVRQSPHWIKVKRQFFGDSLSL